MADKILRAACKRIAIEGFSTHSFRRTALTQMHNAGIPLRKLLHRAAKQRPITAT